MFKFKTKQDGDKKEDKKDDHRLLNFLIVAVILVFLIYVYMTYAKEQFQDAFYLDQIANNYSDPMYFKYAGNERDIAGQSSRDYFLENQRYAHSYAAPQLLAGNAAFRDQTNYLDMPKQYRPKPMSAYPGQSGSTMAQERDDF